MRCPWVVVGAGRAWIFEISAAEAKKVAALMAKSTLNGVKMRSAAASAQPPTLMASALARTSAFAP